MQEKITTIYCLCDDFLRAWGHRNDPQAKMSTAEVLTVALAAAALFGGGQEKSRLFLRGHGYIKAMLSKSRLNRRLHAVPEAAWQALFSPLAQAHRQMNAAGVYAVDSMPIPACAHRRTCKRPAKQKRVSVRPVQRRVRIILVQPYALPSLQPSPHLV